MTTITLDLDEYENRLNEAKNEGWKSGILAASNYVKDNEENYMNRQAFPYECNMLNGAISVRMRKEFSIGQ